MAPDKIYIHEASALDLAEPVLKEYHIEYIRKDALMEWAKEELSKASVSSNSIGRRNAFIDIIDKLNSM